MRGHLISARPNPSWKISQQIKGEWTNTVNKEKEAELREILEQS